MDIIRASFLGELIHRFSKVEFLLYPEERPEFKLPASYAQPDKERDKEDPVAANDPRTDSSDAGSQLSDELGYSGAKEDARRSLSIARIDNLDLEQAITHTTTHDPVNRTLSQQIAPTRTSDGITLVGWYTTDDPANPQNWSLRKKLFVTSVICIYTFSVYIGSSLYTSSQAGIMEKFGVSEVSAALGLALYVLAYGIGPMLFSPLSEIPTIGRNPPYVITYALFVILCVPTSVVNNFAGLMVLRFLLGFFGSPCLATGGASFGDMYAPNKMPYALAFWAGSATMGPALGPVISGFAVSAKGWRWSSWELLWLSAPIFIFLFLALPETSADTILLRRAERLRKVTGRSDLKSQSEINQASMTINEVAFEALVKPWEINALDPAVLFSTVYTALVYGIFYSFFESFPLVYPKIYGFNLGETGLPFLSVLVALGVCIPAYCAYFYYYAEPIMLSSPGFGQPEERLVPGLFASVFIPVGCFLFAWTTRPSIHWIASVFGVGLNMFGTYLVMQCIFLYLPFTYPKYSASLFAANDLARSAFAAGAILFGRPMFIRLGVPGGVSLLGGLTVVCIGGLVLLYMFGARMRSKSRFAAK